MKNRKTSSDITKKKQVEKRKENFHSVSTSASLSSSLSPFDSPWQQWNRSHCLHIFRDHCVHFAIVSIKYGSSDSGLLNEPGMGRRAKRA